MCERVTFKMIVFLCLCVRGDYSGIVILCVCVGSFYFPPLALKPFLGQAADSSLDSYLDFCSITERCLFCFISLLIPSASSFYVLPNSAAQVQQEASRGSYIFFLLHISPLP